jgi:RNA polymerase sigma-70 factor (subfamily 1)
MPADDVEWELVQQATAGERGALSQLLLLHYDRLRAHLTCRIAPDVQRWLRVDDVLHQTFVRAAQAISGLRPQHHGSFPAWLKTIADNLVKDAEKRRRRERRAADEPRRTGTPDESGSWVALVERLAGDSTSPSGRLQRRESMGRLQAALAILPPDQRDVIQRYYLQDQSLEQIAEVLGRTPDAVRGVCYRARKNLRALMGRSSLYFSG